MIDIKWHKGAPDELQAGMVIRHAHNGAINLIGTRIPLEGLKGHDISAWAWIIQPYELKWLGEKCKL